MDSNSQEQTTPIQQAIQAAAERYERLTACTDEARASLAQAMQDVGHLGMHADNALATIAELETISREHYPDEQERITVRSLLKQRAQAQRLRNLAAALRETLQQYALKD